MVVEELQARVGFLARSAKTTSDGISYAAILACGALLFWLSENHPASMPAWMPWDFSPPIYLATAFVLLWFVRGCALASRGQRLPLMRGVAFVLGVVVTYAVLQTRFEYWSQHMFFLNRIQHVVMHHVGPFLIALGAAGGTIKRGMPVWTQRTIESPIVAASLRVFQQPALAAFLFVGLFYFWLIPGVHFVAMIDARVYALMNWSMVLDGILFWSLVLDARPKPPARVSFGTRSALTIGVMFPQIIGGAMIVFSGRDLYPYYDLCGRLFPSINALTDQHIGGIILWIPPAMMSVIGLLLVLNAFRLDEAKTEETDDDAASLARLSSRWTGL
jgi:putative membrane protein